jgi:hypothetical protein
VARARFNITNPARLDADRAIEVCAQCHAATTGDGTGLPFPLAASGPFHPGAALADHAGSAADLWPAGVAAGPGQQADEHLASPHWTPGGYGMQCHDCHDPHAAATDAGGAPMPAQLRLDHRDNALCLSCHASRTFAGSARAIEAHDGHVFEEDPAGPTHRGRCTGCHMPPVAARVRIAASSGAGDLASHGFVALPPRHTLDEFDARGASTLALGEFPAHSCGECHAYNRWLTESQGFLFLPASGDPTLRASHEAYQAAFELKFP